MTLGTNVRPRAWSVSYPYCRRLRDELGIMVRTPTKVLVISQDIDSSHVHAQLCAMGHTVTTAVPAALDGSLRFMSTTTNDRIPWSTQDFIVIDRILLSENSYASAIAEAHRLLRPGGQLLIVRDRIPDNDPHYRLSGAADVTATLAGFDLEVIDQKKLGAVGSEVAAALARKAGLERLRWAWLRRSVKVMSLLLIPVGIALGTAANLVIGLIDKGDRSGNIYVSSLTLARKRGAPTSDAVNTGCPPAPA
jgi:hypothetical protein